MNIEPLNNMVVIRRDDPVIETGGGIQGVVVAAHKGQLCSTGVGLEFSPSKVKRGDVVMFHRSSGMEVTIQGNNLRIMDEQEILLKVVE